MDEFIVFGAPDIQSAEIDEVVDSMQSGWLGTGPKVAQFENDFAKYKELDPELVAALNSCTAALHVSMVAAGVGPGDEVITTAMTFCATVNAIIHAGATPVLADINPATLNIDPVDIKKRLTDRTCAILPVHFAGRACDMKSIMEIARHQLSRLSDSWQRRQEIWNRYNEAFASLPVTLPANTHAGTIDAHHLCTIQIDVNRTGCERDTFLERMTAHKIGVGVHYLSLTEHPYYQQRYGWSAADCPNAASVGQQTVSLPLSPKLTDNDVGRVIQAVSDSLSANNNNAG